jgi:putative addiction module killer protein
MEIAPVEIAYYQTGGGDCPVKRWLGSLDGPVQDIMDARLIRVRRGLIGDAKPVGGGVWELRFDVGPGSRVYFGRDGKTVIVLLCAGHKKGQSNDIHTAAGFWADYVARKKR